MEKRAVYKDGRLQKFSTLILAKKQFWLISKKMCRESYFYSEMNKYYWIWVAWTINYGGHPVNLVSVHSPAWELKIDESDRLLDLATIIWRSKIRFTELLWACLKDDMRDDEMRIVGGDFNSSETFDKEYQIKHNLSNVMVVNGNKDIRDRMYSLGFRECVLENYGRLVPTFKNKDWRIIHQLDHLYISKNMINKITHCKVENSVNIFGKSLSDHLPIIAIFKD